MGLNFGQILQQGSATALETAGKQLAGSTSLAPGPAAPSISANNPGTATAATTSQAPPSGTQASPEPSYEMPKWVKWALGIGGVLVVGSVIYAVAKK